MSYRPVRSGLPSGARCRGGEVRFAIGGARNAGRAILRPLSRERRHACSQGDDGHEVLHRSNTPVATPYTPSIAGCPFFGPDRGRRVAFRSCGLASVAALRGRDARSNHAQTGSWQTPVRGPLFGVTMRRRRGRERGCSKRGHQPLARAGSSRVIHRGATRKTTRRYNARPPFGSRIAVRPGLPSDSL